MWKFAYLVWMFGRLVASVKLARNLWVFWSKNVYCFIRVVIGFRAGWVFEALVRIMEACRFVDVLVMRFI